ncbi:MAG: bifunctional riboflavin kinase/FAD synthetase [Chloroflexi bacterium]|nr:bifunctional riboflavin kinase/FAD synthetase [Chloroflexota bacterium]
MKAYQELAQVEVGGGSAATIGVFDGVHLGHQHLFRHLKRLAKANGLLSAVVTFRNHPRQVLRPEQPVSLLCSLERRLEQVRAQGIDLVVPITFDRELSLVPAHDFVAMLQETLKLRWLVIGPDFALGHNREGNADFLQAMGRQAGFGVSVVQPLVQKSVPVRSTTIRQAVAQGDVGLANRLLGYPFTLEGMVRRGDGRGRLLGFPTANLEVPTDSAMPADGIYATWAIVDGRRNPAATSIGVRPTFGGGRRTVEAFLLDFSGDLYDKPMSLAFTHRLREERHFDSVDALVAQMREDVAQARRLLMESPAPQRT